MHTDIITHMHTYCYAYINTNIVTHTYKYIYIVTFPANGVRKALHTQINIAYFTTFPNNQCRSGNAPHTHTFPPSHTITAHKLTINFIIILLILCKLIPVNVYTCKISVAKRVQKATALTVSVNFSSLSDI